VLVLPLLALVYLLSMSEVITGLVIGAVLGTFGVSMLGCFVFGAVIGGVIAALDE
jgi:hypothetical protein